MVEKKQGAERDEKLVEEYIKRIRLNDFAGQTERESPGEEQEEIENIRKQAEEKILEAERHKASLAPQGRFANQILTIPPNENPIEYLKKLLSDEDDQFFHTICHIDPQLKERIKCGKYVELEKLLIKNKLMRPGRDDDRMELQIKKDKNGETYLAPGNAEKEIKINGISKWDQAFRIYATIYSQSNPTRSSEIWQYVDVIHRAAKTFNWANVAHYDYVFRQLMAEYPNRSWAKTYTQMWNMCLLEQPSTGYVNQNSHNNNNANQKRNRETGICWRYNKGKCPFGQNCRFEHRCSYCFGANHPASQCFKKNGNGNGNNNGAKNKRGKAQNQGQDHSKEDK